MNCINERSALIYAESLHSLQSLILIFLSFFVLFYFLADTSLFLFNLIFEDFNFTYIILIIMIIIRCSGMFLASHADVLGLVTRLRRRLGCSRMFRNIPLFWVYRLLLRLCGFRRFFFRSFSISNRPLRPPHKICRGFKVHDLITCGVETEFKLLFSWAVSEFCSTQGVSVCSHGSGKHRGK